MDLSALRGAAIKEYFNQPVVDTFDVGICPVAEPCTHEVDFRTVKEASLATIDIPLRFQINQCSTVSNGQWFFTAQPSFFSVLFMCNVNDSVWH